MNDLQNENVQRPVLMPFPLMVNLPSLVPDQMSGGLTWTSRQTAAVRDQRAKRYLRPSRSRKMTRRFQ